MKNSQPFPQMGGGGGWVGGGVVCNYSSIVNSTIGIMRREIVKLCQLCPSNFCLIYFFSAFMIRNNYKIPMASERGS